MATRAVHPGEVAMAQPPEAATNSANRPGPITTTAIRLRNGQEDRALAYLRWAVDATGSVAGSAAGSVAGIERIKSSIIVDHLLQRIQPTGEVTGPVRAHSPTRTGPVSYTHLRAHETDSYLV